jgi:hypothetical protein
MALEPPAAPLCQPRTIVLHERCTVKPWSPGLVHLCTSHLGSLIAKRRSWHCTVVIEALHSTALWRMQRFMLSLRHIASHETVQLCSLVSALAQPGGLAYSNSVAERAVESSLAFAMTPGRLPAHSMRLLAQQIVS